MSKVYLHKIGTKKYPIPVGFKKEVVKGLDGKEREVIKVKWLADDKKPLYVPTMRDETTEQIYGRFIREVVSDPNLLPDMVEIMTRLDERRTSTKTKSYAYTAIGAPGNGKTYLMKAIGRLLHEKGAIVLECKNLKDPEQVYKRTEIGVNKVAKKNKIDAHLTYLHKTGGELSSESLAYLVNALGVDSQGDSVVSQEKRENGKTRISIDWTSINESPDYIEMVCDKFMAMENITYDKDTSNSIGIGTSNGPLINALNPDHPDFGRIVILDEYNRLPEGEGLLSVEAFMSEPGADRLKLSGGDDKEYTFERSAIPQTFMYLATGNQAQDNMGMSAREDSRPEISRKGAGIDTRTISNPQKEDFISRTLKHLTGSPAYYVHMLNQEAYETNPAKLSAQVKYFREVGLTEEEKKEIPAEEKFNIKHIDRTIKTGIAVGSLLYEADQLIQAMAEDESLASGYTDYLANRAVVDLRYVFKLYQHSKIDKLEGSSDASVLDSLGIGEDYMSDFDVKSEQEKAIKTMDRAKALTKGTDFGQEILSKLHEMFYPDDLSEKLKGAANKEDTVQKIDEAWSQFIEIAKGLKFEFAGYHGKDSIEDTFNAKPEDFPDYALSGVKSVLIESINDEYNQNYSMSDVIDDEALDLALKSLANDDELSGMIAVPNFNTDYQSEDNLIEKPIKRLVIEQKDGIDEDKREELVTVREFMSSLMIKQTRDFNIKKLSKESVPETAKALCTDRDALAIAEGSHDRYFVTTVALNNIDDESIGLAHVFFDKDTQRTLMLTDFSVKQSDLERLQKNDITFVNINEIKEKTEANAIADSLLSSMDCKGKGSIVSSLVNASLMRISPESMVTVPESSVAPFIDLALKPKCIDEESRKQIKCIHLTKKEYQNVQTKTNDQGR